MPLLAIISATTQDSFGCRSWQLEACSTGRETEVPRGQARTWNTCCFTSEAEKLQEWAQVPRVPGRQRVSSRATCLVSLQQPRRKNAQPPSQGQRCNRDALMKYKEQGKYLPRAADWQVACGPSPLWGPGAEQLLSAMASFSLATISWALSSEAAHTWAFCFTWL